MTITHIVLFQLKAGLSAEVVNDVCTRMLALKDNCIHPTSQKPYIVSSSGGVDNSPEGLQGGITHAFVVEFSSSEDRDYYVEKDPAHLEFVGTLKGIVEKAQVIDYTAGVF
ncbi:Dabb family protein [Aspergillus puulaauensis]|uniref:Stress-response A/B barrel domain-containing protein n=1 Tax=Aspergillus puulaauensis TaxID=1220207 RepID=A0A7R8AQF7_9EURO|nr:uncharacterized protein APUU_50534A [Aspergillus puulaauensis]BCS25823.1 hypothetical protein APUU_50534A [Aspergillus puulaauensis]